MDMGYWEDAWFEQLRDGIVLVVLRSGPAYYVGAVAWGWGSMERYWASVEEVA